MQVADQVGQMSAMSSVARSMAGAAAAVCAKMAAARQRTAEVDRIVKCDVGAVVCGFRGKFNGSVDTVVVIGPLVMVRVQK